MRLLWNIWGWIFFRWWLRFCHLAGTWRWFKALRHWCWSHPEPLVTRKFRLFIWRAISPRELSCPHCGYYDWTEHDDLFVCTNGGSYFTGEYTCHWFEGVQTCARCGQANEYGDSD